MNLSEKLVSSRKSKNISQKDMAAKLGISVASLNRYEGGIREIDLNVLKKLAEITEKTVEWFFDESINNAEKGEEEMYRTKFEDAQNEIIRLLKENAILKEKLLGKLQPSKAKKAN